MRADSTGRRGWLDRLFGAIRPHGSVSADMARHCTTVRRLTALVELEILRPVVVTSVSFRLTGVA